MNSVCLRGKSKFYLHNFWYNFENGGIYSDEMTKELVVNIFD